MSTAKTLKKIRLDLGLTQIEMADNLDCYQGAISKYELGIEKPSLKMAKRYIKLAKSKGLKIKLEDIFPDEE